MKLSHLAKASLALSSLSHVLGASILAVFPMRFRSHHLFFQAILRTLAQRGHQVVVYSPFPLDTPQPNYTDVYLNTTFSGEFKLETFLKIKSYWFSTFFMDTVRRSKRLSWFTEKALQQETLKSLLESNDTYDIVITEPFNGQEALLVFGHKFNAPTIAFACHGSNDIINHITGNSLSLSHVPDHHFPFSDHMSFWERFVNSFFTMVHFAVYHLYHLPKQQDILDRFAKDDSTPELTEMVANISLVFLNSYPIVDYFQPLSQNLVPLGGIHLYTAKSPLHESIKTFMDEAEHGVIYFSLGTVIPDDQLPKDFFNSFVTTFKTLKQRVLWKTSAKSIENLPQNVMIAQWVPQQQVLEHPNCRLFITHGGLFSQYEAIHAAVPVVVIPLFADQPKNAEFFRQSGMGVRLDYCNISEDSVSAAINTVLNNPTRYKRNAERLSHFLQDMPLRQADTAVFWVEHLLRHGRTQHLQPASAHLTCYQQALLDIITAVLLTIITAAMFIQGLYWTCRKLFCSLRSSSYNKNKKHN